MIINQHELGVNVDFTRRIAYFVYNPINVNKFAAFFNAYNS